MYIKKNKKIDSSTLYAFEFSDYLFQEAFEEQLSDYDEFETFPDLTEGSTLKVTFAEDSFAGNKYAKPTRFDFVPRDEQYDEGLIDEIPSLDDCFKIHSYETLYEMLHATPSEKDDEDDDEEEEEPKKRAGKKLANSGSTKKKPQKVEDDDEEEEEEEEEPAPRRSTKKPPVKKRVVEEDEDEEEEEEEEEEEPAPKKRGGNEVKESSDKCPNGHRYGKDADKFEDCDNCKLWNKCYDAMKKSKK